MVVHEFFHNTRFCHQQLHSKNNDNDDNIKDINNKYIFDIPEDDDDFTLLTDSTPIDTTTVSGHQNFNPELFDDVTFSGNMRVPYDDLGGFECLPNFDDELPVNEDLPRMQHISGIKASNDAESKNCEMQPHPNNPTSPMFNPQVPIPAKARTKRTRGPPCNWNSHLLVLSPTMSSPVPSPGDHVVFPPMKPAPRTRNSDDNKEEGRKCLHCATDKTPQWRTGPLGPKTLCNACGVRYKSGRLVPEYRPAASPTFTQTEHSNSHRKVMELRRQKEMSRAQPEKFIQEYQDMSMMYDVSSNRDRLYLIHGEMGPYFT